MKLVKLFLVTLMLSFQPFAMAIEDTAVQEATSDSSVVISLVDILGSEEEAAQTLEEMLLLFPDAAKLSIEEIPMVWKVITSWEERGRNAVTRHGQVAEFSGWLTSRLDGYAFLYIEDGAYFFDVTIQLDNGSSAERIVWMVLPASGPVMVGESPLLNLQQMDLISCSCGDTSGTCDEDAGDCDYMESCTGCTGCLCAFRAYVLTVP